MSLTNSKNSYGSITKFLHWTIGALLIFQFLIVYLKEIALEDNKELGIFFIKSLHKPIGVVILGLVGLRILWRLSNTTPSLPASIPTWQKLLSHLIHFLLYVTMLVMPISGIIMSQAGGYGVFLWGYKLPSLLNVDKELAKNAFSVHLYTSYALIVLFILHVAAAIKHHYINKDKVLIRMLPFKS